MSRLKRILKYLRDNPGKIFVFLFFLYLILSAGLIYIATRMNKNNVNWNNDNHDSHEDAVQTTYRDLAHHFNQPISPFLQKQRKIRTFLRNNPGFGDQTATVNVMSALRQSGFKGKFEVIYAKQIKHKVQTLFALPRELPDSYDDIANNISFIGLSKYMQRMQNHTVERVNIGFSVGRSGGPCTSQELQEETSTLCNNYATFLNTNLGIDFDPYFGNNSDTTFAAHGAKTEFRQVGSGFKFYVFPISTINQAINFLQYDPQAVSLRNIKPGLHSFMQGLKQGDFINMSLYGGSLQEESCKNYLSFQNHENFKACALANFLQVLTAARFAQLNHPELVTQPLVLSLFFDEPQLIHQLNAFLRDPSTNNDIATISNFSAMITSLKLDTEFEVINLRNKRSVYELANLTGGKIYLVLVGKLPQRVFDGVYTYTNTNTLPAVREGMTALNSLIQTGRPHLRCAPKWELNFVPPDEAELQQSFATIYKESGFCDGMTTWERHPNLYQLVGQLIIQGFNTTSAFSKYALKLRKEALDEKNNRVMSAINKAESFFEKPSL